jgi:hypothetical protein
LTAVVADAGASAAFVGENAKSNGKTTANAPKKKKKKS